MLNNRYFSRVKCLLGWHDWRPIESQRLLGDQNLETREFKVVGSVNRHQCSRCRAVFNVARYGKSQEKSMSWISRDREP